MPRTKDRIRLRTQDQPQNLATKHGRNAQMTGRPALLHASGIVNSTLTQWLLHGGPNTSPFRICLRFDPISISVVASSKNGLSDPGAAQCIIWTCSSSSLCALFNSADTFWLTWSDLEKLFRRFWVCGSVSQARREMVGHHGLGKGAHDTWNMRMVHSFRDQRVMGKVCRDGHVVCSVTRAKEKMHRF